LQKRVSSVPRAARFNFRAGQSRKRLLLMFGVTAVLLVAVIGRIIQLQTADAAELLEAGRDQRTSERVVRAGRGVIFDRDGQELALSIPATTVFADPRLVQDPQATVAMLGQLLALSPEKQQELVEAFTAKDRGFVYVARQVTDSEAAAVEALELNGVGTVAEPKRVMPAGSIGRGVIGRTDVDGVGTAGLELQYDDWLSGIDGAQIREHDRDGRSLPGAGVTTQVQPVPGGDIVLTIDRSVQREVERALAAQVATLSARGGTVVVLDTDSGEVLAMAGVRRDQQTGEVYVTSGNIAVIEAAEPGSVVKAITVAAALNEGTVTPDTEFEIPFRKQYSDTVLEDAEQHPTEFWTVSKILTKSSNIGTIETMLTLGGGDLRTTKQILGAYLTSVGLGAKTALDYPNESRGLGADWTEWEGAEQYTVSYGQGIASTSIQLVSAINMIANSGVYVAPKLLKATIDASGELRETPASEQRIVVRPDVAAQVTAMMQGVVCEGTAKAAQIDGISVAGKTGTGLKALEGGGYEDEDGKRKYYSSFAGFFPAEDPQVTILVSIDEPPGAEGQDTRFGGTAAAPVFARIAPLIMHELDIRRPPSGGCPTR
jgi:cell division protein FtsI (penicillin-binding protein 3)